MESKARCRRKATEQPDLLTVLAPGNAYMT